LFDDEATTGLLFYAGIIAISLAHIFVLLHVDVSAFYQMREAFLDYLKPSLNNILAP
jgi:hypothetical protein